MSFVKLERILGQDETSAFFCPVFRIRDVLIRQRLRILLFSSVAFKMPTKSKFFPLVFFLLITYSSKFTSVFKDSKLLISHKTVEIQVYLIFLLVVGMIQSRIRIRTNNYGSKSGRPKSLRNRIRNTAFSCSWYLNFIYKALPLPPPAGIA